MKIPNKTDCYYILEMLESGLIDFSYIHPWAYILLKESESPPSWLIDMAVKEYQGDQIKALGDYIFKQPFVPEPVDMVKFHVGCLWLRYERREYSWATFLKEAGEYLDAADGDWDCETLFHYLNIYEDSYFSFEVEESTKQQYLADHDLKPWIELAKEKFKPFIKANKG